MLPKHCINAILLLLVLSLFSCQRDYAIDQLEQHLQEETVRVTKLRASDCSRIQLEEHPIQIHNTQSDARCWNNSFIFFKQSEHYPTLELRDDDKLYYCNVNRIPPYEWTYAIPVSTVYFNGIKRSQAQLIGGVKKTTWLKYLAAFDLQTQDLNWSQKNIWSIAFLILIFLLLVLGFDSRQKLLTKAPLHFQVLAYPTFVMLLMGLSKYAIEHSSLHNFSIFSNYLNVPFQHDSTGGYILLMMGLLFISLFIQDIIRKQPPHFESKRIAKFVAGASTLGLLALSIVLFAQVQSYVVDAHAIGKLDELYTANMTTYGMILGIMLCIFSLFFLAYANTVFIQQLNISLQNRFWILSASVLLSIPIYIALDIRLSEFGYYSLLLALLVLMDVFVESKVKSLSWLIIWIISLSTGFASLLYVLHRQSALNDMKVQARDLYSFYEQQKVANASDIPINFDSEYDWKIFDGHHLAAESPQAAVTQIDLKLLPPSGQSRAFNSLSRLFMLYRASPDVAISVSKRHHIIFQNITLFSFLFSALSIGLFILLLTNQLVPLLPSDWRLGLRQKRSSIGRKFQLAIFSVLIISFTAVMIMTYYFLKTYQQDFVEQQELNYTQNVEESLNNHFDALISGNDSLKITALHTSHYPFEILDQDGFVLISNLIRSEEQISNLPISYQQGSTLDEQYHQKKFFDIEGHRFVLVPKKIGNNYFFTYIPLQSDEIDNGNLVNNLLGTLFNIYIFLFVIASSIALTYSDSITRPLRKLSESISGVRLGQSNNRIEWESRDEVGQLIDAYNEMIEKIEESAQTLAITEREVAWREMAKQVAHEIKNPLTPMKLSIQYLLNTLQQRPEKAAEISMKTCNTLLEQIDNLSTIASEFSSFAKMPKAENEKLMLNEIIANIHDLFRKREDININLYIPIDDLFVYADRHYLYRIVINLIKNAIQAIPQDRQGNILLHLYKEGDNALIRVKDNGIGIPDNIKDKVFKPNFTSKNSGTGLGLAISANIVESFNGRIYFETEIDKGTTFFVEIPLMHMKDNFKNPKRVMLS